LTYPVRAGKACPHVNALLYPSFDKLELTPLPEPSPAPGEVIVQVAADARGLTAQLTGQPALRVYPRSATELFYRAVAASLVFELAGDASVPAAVTLHQSGRRIRCERQADAGK
jgi:hypothetical protein